MEFPVQEDIQGLDTEHYQLRRLYRVLNLPTGDLRHNREKTVISDAQRIEEIDEEE